MDLEQAKEINAKVLAYAFWGYGFTELRPAEKITESLSELIEACHMVNEASENRFDSMTDGGIAAVYVATHFIPNMSIIARGNEGSLILVPDSNISRKEE